MFRFAFAVMLMDSLSVYQLIMILQSDPCLSILLYGA